MTAPRKGLSGTFLLGMNISPLTISNVNSTQTSPSPFPMMATVAVLKHSLGLFVLLAPTVLLVLPMPLIPASPLLPLPPHQVPAQTASP